MKKFFMKKFFIILCITSILATSILAGCSSATNEPKQENSTDSGKTYDLKLNSSFPPNHAENIQLVQFAKKLEERTNGKVKITLYEGTLGAQTDAWDMTKKNTVQITFKGEAYNPSRMPITNMIELPFEVPDVKSELLVANEWLKAGYLKELTDNFKVLFYAPLNPQRLFLRDKKITTIEQLKGLKIATVSSVQAQTVTALGATGVSMKGADLYMGLDRGVIDGSITGVDNIVDRKLTEVTKYAVDLPMYGGTFVLVMNKETWNSLPADIQKIIDETSQEIASSEVKRLQDGEKSLWETVRKKLDVYTISKEEETKWRKAILGVTDSYVTDIAAKGYPAKEALDLMRKVVNENKK